MSRDVLRWKVKTRSGFTVGGDEPAKPGVRLTITFRILGITIREPVEVVDVHASPTRVGFSYRTLPGHPVSGEEAFIVSRVGDEVVLTVRSLTKPSPQQPWRAMFPALRVAQLVVRRRYLRALRDTGWRPGHV
ncbi:A3(2) GLYCOGEN METABOLISM CLUSTERI [Frigoribacterium sp. JB110]|nr:A3(2) GLYCOGEN METABOLISM CLUSTERI [Frigoribacterium sp. JB110]